MLGPHTPHDLFLAVDEALEVAPASWRMAVETWHAGLQPADRAFVEAQRADFVRDCSSPLVHAAAVAWAGPEGARHLAAFLLGCGVARAHVVLRDPDLLADLDHSRVTPWPWMPDPPDVGAPPAGELERRCPRLAGVDALADWPEVAALPEAEWFRRALRGAPNGWSLLQEVCAPLGDPAPAGPIAMPFLLAHRGLGMDDDALVQIGAAALELEPDAPWRDALRALALLGLATGPVDDIVITDLARILGDGALSGSMAIAWVQEARCTGCGAAFVATEVECVP
ncbi:MAG: hypothetical protein R3F61_34605 [Myxococcota bacterium]